ncbi:hypothetical protein [Desulfosarcina sp.]|jgi:hypothetical protein|uniref:hypothetical protein n=1 Tax=Desulfosarcina sp. TaxID=2027861 RepID=UPI00397056E5
MKSLHISYNEATQTIDRIDNAAPEHWGTVCERFDNDVQRIKDVSDASGYNALYVCYDANNQPEYYLVEEDAALLKLRRKTFLSKLGQTKV